jgi:hypothetical protein
MMHHTAILKVRCATGVYQTFANRQYGRNRKHCLDKWLNPPQFSDSSTSLVANIMAVVSVSILLLILLAVVFLGGVVVLCHGFVTLIIVAPLLVIISVLLATVRRQPSKAACISQQTTPPSSGSDRLGQGVVIRLAEILVSPLCIAEPVSLVVSSLAVERPPLLVSGGSLHGSTSPVGDELVKLLSKRHILPVDVDVVEVEA